MVKTCQECTLYRYRNVIIDQTGYLPENEDWNNIPDVIPPFDDNDLDSLPGMVSIEHLFPPIGDQGNKGTCVAWAVGYNLKTALNAIDNHWAPEQLDSAIYQTSPKDLWLCIPQSQKGTNCSGTCFEPAFAALMSDGVATMQAVPYENLGNCNGRKTGDSNNKLVSFSRIVSETEMPRIEHLKAYLDAGTPLVFGARLGDRFMNWNSSAVISSDIYNYTGMHASHAMVLTGYDDSKNAFRIRNSWGKAWGDEGSIWVDYQFFCNNFCYAVFVAQNEPDGSSE
jgi:C1A family cysteine protease